MFRDQSLTPLMWIIEQAASSNITSALAFASCHTSISIGCMRDQSMMSYAGKPDASAALTHDTLENMGRILYDLSNNMAGRDHL